MQGACAGRAAEPFSKWNSVLLAESCRGGLVGYGVTPAWIGQCKGGEKGVGRTIDQSSTTFPRPLELYLAHA